jgi:UDP-glucose 4-epimerase
MKAVITGINGLIGSSLNKRLLNMGWEIYETLRPDVDYVFLFGSPSSDIWYKYAKNYSIRETIENFINTAEFCQRHGIKLVYPSSGVVYEGLTTYARSKRVLEALAPMYGKTLGLRIFAGYGVGEEHKKEYSSTIYQFIKEMMKGKQPVIWGDGTQTRDWIYIDDIIDNIIKFKDEEGMIDIGTGINHSMNEIVHTINKVLHTKIEPEYINKPQNYVENTICEHPCEHKVSLEEGIRKIIKSL